jgi:methanogenic corrinoid protein MtbC1
MPARIRGHGQYSLERFGGSQRILSRDLESMVAAARGDRQTPLERRSGAGVLASLVNTITSMGLLLDSSRPKRAVFGAACLAIFAAGLALLVTSASALAATLIGALLLLLAGGLLGLWLGSDRRKHLESEIDARSDDLQRVLSELETAQAETVRRLSMAVEFRDEDTGAHIERIGRFSMLLAKQIGMDEDFCMLLSHAAPLHDVGKVAIPDSILLKPGPLTPDERAIVETHAEEGHRLLQGSSSSILEMAATVALSHHEKWDGSGYPRGVLGEAIPVEGRIVAIADVFDALTSDRVYRKAFSVEQAVEMMLMQRGRHFDPVLLDAFMEVLGSSGPDAQARHADDPQTLIQSVLDVYGQAIEHGDAETAEGAIMQAIEDGIKPTALHGQVIFPAMSELRRLTLAGEIDPEAEQHATGITRRILATLYRYMLGSTEPTRERVLLAGIDADGYPLGLQMVNDQLAAAGYRTLLEADLTHEGLTEAIDSHSPELIVLASGSTTEADLGGLLERLRQGHPDIPVLLGGTDVIDLRQGYPGVEVLEQIERSVAAVEELLEREHALG